MISLMINQKESKQVSMDSWLHENKNQKQRSTNITW